MRDLGQCVVGCVGVPPPAPLCPGCPPSVPKLCKAGPAQLRRLCGCSSPCPSAACPNLGVPSTQGWQQDTNVPRAVLFRSDTNNGGRFPLCQQRSCPASLLQGEGSKVVTAVSGARCQGPLGPQGITLHRHNSSWVNCRARGASAAGCWSASHTMLKPGGTHHGAPQAEMGSSWPPLPPPQHLTLPTPSAAQQEIPSHTCLIFYNTAAISATHPERIFNEKRGERARSTQESRGTMETLCSLPAACRCSEFSPENFPALLEVGSAAA